MVESVCSRIGDRTIALFTDITERKRSEAILQASEERLQNLYSLSPVGIFLCTPDGRYLSANQALADLLGYATAEDLVHAVDSLPERTFHDPGEWHDIADTLKTRGKFVNRLVKRHKKDGTPIWVLMFGHSLAELSSLAYADLSAGYPPYSQIEAEARVALARSGEAQDFEWLARHRDGQLFWIEVHLEKVRFKTQDSLICVIRDISRRKSSERAIRESEKKFRPLAEAIGEVFWLGSPDWKRVFYISPAYARLWGRSTTSLYDVPLSWLDALPPEDHAPGRRCGGRTHPTDRRARLPARMPALGTGGRVPIPRAARPDPRLGRFRSGHRPKPLWAVDTRPSLPHPLASAHISGQAKGAAACRRAAHRHRHAHPRPQPDQLLRRGGAGGV